LGIRVQILAQVVGMQKSQVVRPTLKVRTKSNRLPIDST
jgi:hypothetical protein